MGELIEMKDMMKIPEHLRKYQDTAQEEARSLITTTTGGNRISIRGKQFRFVKDGEEVAKIPMGKALSIVILKADPKQGTAKAYYKEAYSPDMDSPPDCHSADGVTPSANSSQVQNSDCATCKWNAFGSGVDASGNSTKGKACGDHKILFVVESDNIDGQIWRLSVPATSLKALAKYGAKLADHKVDISGVITQVYFNEDATHPQLEFDPVNFLDEGQFNTAIKQRDSSELQLMLPSAHTIPAQPTEKKLPSPPGATPPAKEPTPTYTMTAKAEGISREAYHKSGWTDDQLVEYGMMEITND